MTEEGFKRKLTAILSADVEGYSRLMGEDEEATIRTLTTYRELMSTLIQKRQGRVVDSPGDNLLAEFGSVVDGVRCAVEIQEELRVRNAELSENRKMQFRIGVNLGDVVEEGDRIYGDGVNITARVEGLAKGGGICISGTVYDHIKNKLSLSYESLGEHTVKNIIEPVRVYRMRIGPEGAGAVVKEEKAGPKRWRWAALPGVAALILVIGAVAIWNFYFRPPKIEPASVDNMAFPLPDKPSIAVLPFVNMSDDPEQEYFSDGLTEEIISALSRVPRLFVIARNSTFTYKGKPVKVQRVSEELGVRYVLEGSVRKAGDRVRITAQLVDATTGHHLWSERYDRTMKDIFALQDEITKNVIIAMQIKLTEGEPARLWGKGTDNLEAYLKYVKGLEHFKLHNPDAYILAGQFLKEAIALDPEYANPYVLMGAIHIFEVWPPGRPSKSPQKSIEQAFKWAQKALALDESNPELHNLLGQIYEMKGQNEKAIAAYERSVALDPNYITSRVLLGLLLTRRGKPQEALLLLKKTVRLNPLAPGLAFYGLGTTYSSMGRYEEAIQSLKKALQYRPKFLAIHTTLASCYFYSGREEEAIEAAAEVLKFNPKHLLAHLLLAASYAVLGREEEAQAAAAEVLRLNPKFSLQRIAKRWAAFMNQAQRERFIDVLRKAGLK